MRDTVKKIATRDAYGKALVELGRGNKDVVVLDADLSKSTKTAGFAKEFPERFFQMGIAEQDMMGTAAGFAAAGKIPFASSFAIFATGRAFEQIRNTIGYPHLNVKICATHAGITVGEDGASHQSIEDISLMRSIPGMTVIVPSDGIETEKAIFAAAEHDGPVYIRLGRSAVPLIFEGSYDFEIGRAVTLKEGGDVSIIATGIMVTKALEAAERLDSMGMKARVINMHTIKPLDEDAVIRSAEETGALVTVEEHSVIGGLGSSVCEAVCGEHPVPVIRVGIADIFGQSGTPEELLVEYGLTVENIADQAKRAISMKRR